MTPRRYIRGLSPPSEAQRRADRENKTRKQRLKIYENLCAPYGYTLGRLRASACTSSTTQLVQLVHDVVFGCFSQNMIATDLAAGENLREIAGRHCKIPPAHFSQVLLADLAIMIVNKLGEFLREGKEPDIGDSNLSLDDLDDIDDTPDDFAPPPE